MNMSTEERIEQLERAMRLLTERIEKALERRAIRKITRRSSFRNRVLETVNEHAVNRDVTVRDITSAMGGADRNAVSQALCGLEKDGFIERVKQGHYRAYADDDPLPGTGHRPS